MASKATIEPPPAAAETPKPAEDAKLTAFNAVIASLRGLTKAEQYAVLNAAAKYFKLDV
jgi:hypothetical protein